MADAFLPFAPLVIAGTTSLSSLILIFSSPPALKQPHALPALPAGQIEGDVRGRHSALTLRVVELPWKVQSSQERTGDTTLPVSIVREIWRLCSDTGNFNQRYITDIGLHCLFWLPVVAVSCSSLL